MATKRHYAKHVKAPAKGGFDFRINQTDPSNTTVTALTDGAFAEMQQNVPAFLLDGQTAPLIDGSGDEFAEGLRGEGWQVEVVGSGVAAAA